MNKNYRNILDSVAGLYIPDDLDLFDRVRAKAGQRRTLMQTMRARPALAVLLAILALLVLTGVAYAIGRSLGYIPGVGFVQPASLRVLAEPVKETRDGVTVTIEKVVVDAERTVVVYKAEGLSLQAANSRGEAPGITSFDNFLRLPDGSLWKESLPEGYEGIPEPLINEVEAEGGWPNYVRRLVYPAADPQIDELTLVIPALQNMPAGTAPENWEITFHLQPAPPDMTVLPILAITPRVEPVLTGAPSVEETAAVAAAPASVSTQNGITLSLDTVIEVEDGYVFTGSISLDPSASETASRIHFWDAVVPTLKDGNGQDVPVEVVYLDAFPDANKKPWSVRTHGKAFVGPLTFSLPSLEGVYDVPPFEYSLDLGTDPRVGQTWDVNRAYRFDGHTVRLLTVELIEPFNGCSLVALEFKLEWEVGGAFASVTDTNSDPPGDYSCESVNGDEGLPIDSRVSLSALLYKNIPNGLHHFTFISQIPYSVPGPWQVRWDPPVTSEPIPTAEPEMCLTVEKWNQIIGQSEALPPGLGGKILLSVYDPNSNANFPTLQLANPDGSNLQPVVQGGWTSLSNDGKRLSYNDAAGLHLLDLSTGQTSTLGMDGYHVIWSPDNTRMMYTNTFNLFVANADGSEPRAVDTGPAQVVAPVGWLADNQTLLYAASMDGGKFGFKGHNLGTGETKDLFTIENKSGFGAVSPDGGWIAYASREFSTQGYDIFISRIDGSERRRIAGADTPATTAVWSPDGGWLVINTLAGDGQQIPVLVNPFSCQALRLNTINGSVEDWSP